MRLPSRGIRLAEVSLGLLVPGAALLLLAVLSRWVTIGGDQVLKGAPWWVQAVLGAVGLLAIGGAVAAGREPSRELRTASGFLGAPPRMPAPARLVERPDLSAKVVAALSARDGLVALTGTGGAGKSTLAAGACGDRQVRRRFPDGVTWLEAGAGQDPVGLLGVLARRLGLPDSDSGFTTVGEGRDTIAAALRGKRLLIGLDNVWDRGPLDALVGLAPGCAVVFTTRLPDLADTFGAAQVAVEELTRGQALELLGRWVGQVPAELPPDAQVLCARVGNLALGVTMVGAMASRGRSFADVLALIEQDLARVRADLDPSYPYPDLLAAIEAGISDLPEASQRRYAQLAVFAGRGRFPRAAAGAVWWPEFTEAETDDLLAGLAGRSLLTAAGDGWYAAHDLQYDALERRLSPADLVAGHARLLAGYAARCQSGWPSGPDDGYYYQHLVGHLAGAGRGDELAGLLTDVEWMRSRLRAGGVTGLLTDYNTVPDEPGLDLVQATIRLSAHVLAVNPDQLPAQLAGRTIGRREPALARLNTAARAWPHAAWLCPIQPALAQPGEVLRQALTGHDGPVLAVAVSADGRTAVSGGHNGTVGVWDLAGTAAPRVLTGHVGLVFAVAVSADGRTAVSGGMDRTVRVWDLAGTAKPRVLTGHADVVRAVAVSADGRTAVSGGMDRTVRVWDLAGTAKPRVLTGHAELVRAVAVSADGRTAVSGGFDGTVGVWDLAGTAKPRVLTGHDGPVSAVGVSADGRTAVSSGQDGTVRVWDLAGTAKPRVLTGHDGPVSALAVSADGRTAVSGDGYDGWVRTWDLAGRAPASPVVDNANMHIAASSSMLRVWDLAGTAGPRVLTGHDGPVSALAVSADGRIAVSGDGYDGIVRVWDLAGTAKPRVLTGHAELVRAVAVSADGRTAVSGSRDGTVGVWDLAGTAKPRVLTGHDGPVSAVGVSADGRTAVSSGQDGTVRVWDLAGTAAPRVLTGHDGPVNAVAVSADGQAAVSGGLDGTVGVWDLAGTAAPRVLTGHVARVNAVAVSADGRIAVSGGRDGTVGVWDLAGTAAPRVLTGHDGPVNAVAVSADGQAAVSGGGVDGTVGVWDLAGTAAPRGLTGHVGRVNAVAVSADGQAAVSSGFDRTVQVWDLAGARRQAAWIADSEIMAVALGIGVIVVGDSVGQVYALQLNMPSVASA